MRLPSSWSKKDKQEKVNEALDVLCIQHIADSRIGDETHRGISGGQRKRVNIGMELVAQPSVLFLDEVILTFIVMNLFSNAKYTMPKLVQ
jgi:ABC-type multidrug transport system ATPase subunit